MKKGDIVLVPFPFTDLTGSKNRPALVLISNDLDVTVSFISTQIKWKEEADILIQPSSVTGIKKDSIIRLSKIATIDKSIVLGRISRLENTSIKTVNNNLIKLFQLVN